MVLFLSRCGRPEKVVHARRLALEAPCEGPRCWRYVVVVVVKQEAHSPRPGLVSQCREGRAVRELTPNQNGRPRATAEDLKGAFRWTCGSCLMDLSDSMAVTTLARNGARCLRR